MLFKLRIRQCDLINHLFHNAIIGQKKVHQILCFLPLHETLTIMLESAKTTWNDRGKKGDWPITADLLLGVHHL